MTTNTSRNNNAGNYVDYLFDRNEFLHGDNHSPLLVRANIAGAKVLFWGGAVFFGLLGTLVNLFS